MRTRDDAARWVPGQTADTCRNGHPYTPQNTAYERSGKRRCKTCRKANKANRTTKAAAPRVPRTHCKDGHLLTRPWQKGRETCVECARLTSRAKYRRRCVRLGIKQHAAP